MTTKMSKLVYNACLWWKKLNFIFFMSLFSGIATYHWSTESRCLLPHWCCCRTLAMTRHRKAQFTQDTEQLATMHVQIMEYIVVNGSVHTACKQHQRGVCTQICMQVCLRLLCERVLNCLSKTLYCITMPPPHWTFRWRIIPGVDTKVLTRI